MAPVRPFIALDAVGGQFEPHHYVGFVCAAQPLCPGMLLPNCRHLSFTCLHAYATSSLPGCRLPTSIQLRLTQPRSLLPSLLPRWQPRAPLQGPAGGLIAHSPPARSPASRPLRQRLSGKTPHQPASSTGRQHASSTGRTSISALKFVAAAPAFRRSFAVLAVCMPYPSPSLNPPALSWA